MSIKGNKPTVPPVAMEDLNGEPVQTAGVALAIETENVEGEIPVLKEDPPIGKQLDDIDAVLGLRDLKALEDVKYSRRDEVQEMIAQAIDKLRLEMVGGLPVVAAVMDQGGIQAHMIGATFNCPLCDLRITGPSLTGQKGVLYEHPFDDSPKLSGQKCKLKGQKFTSPVIYLQFATPQPRPLTGKTE